MENKTISARNMGSLIVIIALCATVLAGGGTAGNNAWISVVIAMFCAIPLVLIYSRILKLFPGEGIFEITKNLFGKIGGAVVAVLFSLYAVFVGSLVLYNFSEYTIMIALKSTPKAAIMIFILIVALYLAGSSIHNIGRWALIILIVVIFNQLFTLFLSLGYIDISNFKPVLDEGLKPVLSDALSFGVIAFGETALVMCMFISFRKGDKPKNAYLGGILFAAAILLFVVVRNILVLGEEMFKAADYPSYSATRVIHFGSFIEHIESLISFNMILIGVTKVAACIRSASMGVCSVIKKPDNKIVLIITGVLTFCIGFTVFKNIQEVFKIIEIYRYAALFFVVLIPLVVWITAEIKVRKENRVMRMLKSD